MTRTPEARAAAIARNRAYLVAVRARTFCAICGKQPVDFHSDKHHHHRHLRVNQRVLAGQTLASIQAEINRCVAWCRSCHMKADGRLKLLHENKPRQPGTSVKLKVCAVCGQEKVRVKEGLCPTCTQAKLRREAETALPSLSRGPR